MECLEKGFLWLLRVVPARRERGKSKRRSTETKGNKTKCNSRESASASSHTRFSLFKRNAPFKASPVAVRFLPSFQRWAFTVSPDQRSPRSGVYQGCPASRAVRPSESAASDPRRPIRASLGLAVLTARCLATPLITPLRAPVPPCRFCRVRFPNCRARLSNCRALSKCRVRFLNCRAWAGATAALRLPKCRARFRFCRVRFSKCRARQVKCRARFPKCRARQVKCRAWLFRPYRP